MVYPIIVIFIAVGIVVFLLTYIVPQFNEIFENMVEGGAEKMPALQRRLSEPADSSPLTGISSSASLS